MHEKILKAGFIAECDETGVRVWMGSPKAMDRLIEAAVLAEREACAKVCEESLDTWHRLEYAAAIRARGEK